MTRSKLLLVIFVLLLGCNTASRDEMIVSFAELSLPTIFDQLLERNNPFEFYNDVFENFRFELKSTIKRRNRVDQQLESITTYESNEENESRFYKKSLDPISEVEWLEKDSREYIRYGDSHQFLRTSYNPKFDKWKRRVFQDIGLVFDLEKLGKSKLKVENQWSCYEASGQKLCLDSKTGLPVFGQATKKLQSMAEISTVFSLVYGADAIPQKETEEKGDANSS